MANCNFKGRRISPKEVKPDESIVNLVDNHFNAYNAARFRESARLYAQKMAKEDVVIGMSLSGALTPAGLGTSCIVPLIRNGLVDWITSTGANLYHDIHFALNLPIHSGSPFFDDVQLRKNQLIRIYDIVFDFNVLEKTDEIVSNITSHSEFIDKMTTSRFHHLLGKYLRELEKDEGKEPSTVLTAAYEYDVPIYSPSPADSSIAMSLALINAKKNINFSLDVIGDILETTAIVYDGKRNGTCGVILIGGGAPKNFMLQTEPQMQEFFRFDIKGFDYFIQMTDARPDTGGLSGATPSEAVSWGKVAPDSLPNSVVVYGDNSVYLPLLTSYILAKVAQRPLKRLFKRRSELVAKLKNDAQNRH